MTDDALSYFEKRLLNEFNRMNSCLEEIRDQMINAEDIDHIKENLGHIESISRDLSSIDKSLSYIDGKIGK